MFSLTVDPHSYENEDLLDVILWIPELGSQKQNQI